MTSSTFQTVKLALVSVTGLSKDSLHVYVGLSVYLLVVLVVRKRFRSLLPWLAVLSVALLGEALDMKDDISSLGYWRWSASIHDIINTIFWPSVVVAMARYTKVFGSKSKHA
jgi:uncharacterized membrane protein YqgA involved in biofilm formation